MTINSRSGLQHTQQPQQFCRVAAHFEKKSVTTFFFLFFGEFETRCDTCVSSSRMISAGFPPLQNQLLPPPPHMHAYAQRVHSIFYCNKFIDISKKNGLQPMSVTRSPFLSNTYLSTVLTTDHVNFKAQSNIDIILYHVQYKPSFMMDELYALSMLQSPQSAMALMH